VLRVGEPQLLFVAGERDGFTPPERSREIAALIPGAELLELANASHTAPIEQPDLVIDAVRAVVEAVRDPASWGQGAQ